MKYYFITWWTYYSECWCNGLLKCVPFTYQQIILGYRYTLISAIGLVDWGAMKDCFIRDSCRNATFQALWMVFFLSSNFQGNKPTRLVNILEHFDHLRLCQGQFFNCWQLDECWYSSKLIFSGLNMEKSDSMAGYFQKAWIAPFLQESWDKQTAKVTNSGTAKTFFQCM